MTDPIDASTDDGLVLPASHDAQPGSRLRKSPSAFRTISEVADELHIPQHVLRFWETRFPQVKPLKRGGGRRYYRPDDIALLRRISHLLYIQGYTIKGVQRLLREGGGSLPDEIPPPSDADRSESDHNHADHNDAGPADAEFDFPVAVALAGADTPREPVVGGGDAALRALLVETLRELEAIRSLLGSR